MTPPCARWRSSGPPRSMTLRACGAWARPSCPATANDSSRLFGSTLLRSEHLVLEQHAHAAGPAVRTSGEIRGLFVQHLAGERIGDLHRHVIVGLRRSSYDA